ncbi:hypothetical protein [Bradyrhizobium pachyrhizi]|uniref:hypothetical protein n=1 Tax=Bradyrhizobium pachyrhizi TaxID=280333 RepID=UPI00067B4D14|nr:hypothetical protein [Bradyrhizobium pachyrhizi]
MDKTATRSFPEIIEASAVELSRIADVLSFGLALENDLTIRQGLRRAAACSTDRPLILKLPHVPAAMEISPTGELRALRQHGASLDHELDALLAGSPELSARMRLVRVKARELANDLLVPLVFPGSLPSRAEFHSVFKWAPLIEMPAYAFGSHTLSILEELRAGAKAEALSGRSENGALAGYYAAVHTMANFMLMGSLSQAAPWLSEMAGSFVWNKWTPSFALTRERTMWLAAAAAKSAAAFGPTVVDFYCRVLSTAPHVFNVFDSLFGLAAIALSYEDAHQEILEAITFHADASAARYIVGREYSTIAFRSAIDLLSRPRSERFDSVAMDRLGWKVSGASDGLASRQAFRIDPTEIDADGRMFGFKALPSILNVSPVQHYPRSKARISRLRLEKSELLELMNRAWAQSSAATSSAIH